MPDKAMLVMDAMMYLGGFGLVQVYALLAVGQGASCGLGTA
jgi:hypothetical protein